MERNFEKDFIGIKEEISFALALEKPYFDKEIQQKKQSLSLLFKMMIKTTNNL